MISRFVTDPTCTAHLTPPSVCVTAWLSGPALQIWFNDNSVNHDVHHLPSACAVHSVHIVIIIIIIRSTCQAVLCTPVELHFHFQEIFQELPLSPAIPGKYHQHVNLPIAIFLCNKCQQIAKNLWTTPCSNIPQIQRQGVTGPGHLLSPELKIWNKQINNEHLFLKHHPKLLSVSPFKEYISRDQNLRETPTPNSS